MLFSFFVLDCNNSQPHITYLRPGELLTGLDTYLLGEMFIMFKANTTCPMGGVVYNAAMRSV